MSHTPGPWEIRKKASINGAHIVGLDGTVVCRISPKADKSLAQKEHDARLIAAAPELLEALLQAQSVLADVQSMSHHHPIYVQMADVIAKATGGAV